MDCDTTGVEPDFALVKFKKLSGGGYFKIVNECVPAALENLGYSATQIDEMVKYAKGHATLSGCPQINPDSLRARGFTSSDIESSEGQLNSALRYYFPVQLLDTGRRNHAAPWLQRRTIQGTRL